jgi:hypothetical protein
MGQRRCAIRYTFVVMFLFGPHVAAGVGVQDEFTLSLDLPAIPWQVVNVLLPQDAVLGTVPVDFQLDGGDYYLTIYGERSAIAGSLAADSQVPDVASLDHIPAKLIRYEQDAGRALYDAKRMLVPQCNGHWLAWCDYNLYGCPAVGVYSCRTEP